MHNKELYEVDGFFNESRGNMNKTVSIFLLVFAILFVFVSVDGAQVSEEAYVNISSMEVEYIEADSTYDSTANEVLAPFLCKHMEVYFLPTSSATEAYLYFPTGKEPINPTSTPSGSEVRGNLIESGVRYQFPIILSDASEYSSRDESIGTGDGATDTYELDYSGAVKRGMKVYFDGTPVPTGDYSLSAGTGTGGVDEVVFNDDVDNTVVITGSYKYVFNDRISVVSDSGTADLVITFFK